MNIRSRNLFIAVIFILSNISYAQNLNALYEIGKWQGFRVSAVCFTFDDGCSNQLNEALPLFNKYNLKMTFFTIADATQRWNLLQKAAFNGHEIASHTCSHLAFGMLNNAQQTTELKHSQDEINSHIKGQKCLTISYPFCDPGNEAICNKYYIAARGCSGKIEQGTPHDFLNISSIPFGKTGKVKTAQEACIMADSAAATKGLVVFLIHGIDNDGGFSPVSIDNLKGALEYLKLNKARFWESTFGNIVRYIKERDDASLKEVSANDNILACRLTCNLDSSIYNYPITIRRQLPHNWASAAVSQNGKVLNSDIVQAGTSNYVMFDAVPNGGEILISKK